MDLFYFEVCIAKTSRDINCKVLANKIVRSGSSSRPSLYSSASRWHLGSDNGKAWCNGSCLAIQLPVDLDFWPHVTLQVPAWLLRHSIVMLISYLIEIQNTRLLLLLQTTSIHSWEGERKRCLVAYISWVLSWTLTWSEEATSWGKRHCDGCCARTGAGWVI